GWWSPPAGRCRFRPGSPHTRPRRQRSSAPGRRPSRPGATPAPRSHGEWWRTCCPPRPRCTWSGETPFSGMRRVRLSLACACTQVEQGTPCIAVRCTRMRVYLFPRIVTIRASPLPRRLAGRGTAFAIGILDGDLAVAEGKDVATVDLDAQTILARPGEGPFRHAPVSTDKMPCAAPM